MPVLVQRSRRGREKKRKRREGRQGVSGGEQEKEEDDLPGGEFQAGQAEQEWRAAGKDIVLDALHLHQQRQSIAGGNGCEWKTSIV